MMSTILRESCDKVKVESKVMKSSLIVMKFQKTSDLLQNGTRWNWFQSRMNPGIQPQQPDPPAQAGSGTDFFGTFRSRKVDKNCTRS